MDTKKLEEFSRLLMTEFGNPKAVYMVVDELPKFATNVLYGGGFTLNPLNVPASSSVSFDGVAFHFIKPE